MNNSLKLKYGKIDDRVNFLEKLQSINEELWNIENYKRECEANKDFGEKFIQLSRDVHFKNDIRAQIKKEINLLTDSIIVEEKEYSKY